MLLSTFYLVFHEQAYHSRGGVKDGDITFHKGLVPGISDRWEGFNYLVVIIFKNDMNDSRKVQLHYVLRSLVLVILVVKYALPR